MAVGIFMLIGLGLVVAALTSGGSASAQPHGPVGPPLPPIPLPPPQPVVVPPTPVIPSGHGGLPDLRTLDTTPSDAVVAGISPNPQMNTVIINPSDPDTGGPTFGTVNTVDTGSAGRLNVHSSPDEQTASIIGTIDHGARVRMRSTLIDTQGNMDGGDINNLYIVTDTTANGKTGYVSAHFIALV